MPFESASNNTAYGESPMGYGDIEVTAPSVSEAGLGHPYATLKVPRKVLLDFCLQMSMGLDAGIPLLKQVQVLADTEPNKRFAGYLLRVNGALVEGRGLAEAMASEPTPFTSSQLAMLQAGAAAGSDFVPKIFSKLRETLETGMALRREVVGALRYPVIVAVIAMGIIIVMLLKVVPSFAQIFKETGAKIPYLTQKLVDMSNFVKGYWGITIIMIVGGVIGLRLLWLFVSRQVLFQTLLLRLPVVGDFLRSSMRCAFFQSMAQLLSAGVPLQKALVIVQSVHSYIYYRSTVNMFIGGVTSGRNLSDCMMESDIFGPRSAQLVATGEKSGGLGAILEKAGTWLEQELLDKLRSLTKLAEPFSIVVLAGMVGGMLAALFLPLFSLAMAFK